MAYSLSSTNWKIPESPKGKLDLAITNSLLKMEIKYWHSYVSQGLANQIEGHSRADQRHYQRKYCSWLSRYEKFKAKHAEFFI